MEEFEITWERALTVWWSIAWRSGLFGFLAALAIGFVIGFFGAILHLNMHFLHRLSILAGILSGAAIGIWVVKRILVKRFKEFRIALVPLDSPDEKLSGRTVGAPESEGRAPGEPADDFSI